MHVNQSWLWIHRSPTGWITFLGSRRAVSRFIIWDLDAMLNYVTKSQTKMTRDRRIQQIITSSIFGFIFWEINVRKRWENRRRKVIIICCISGRQAFHRLHILIPDNAAHRFLSLPNLGSISCGREEPRLERKGKESGIGRKHVTDGQPDLWLRLFTAGPCLGRFR